MKYIILMATFTFLAFTSSCSCQVSGSGSADFICEPADMIKAVS